MNKKITISFVIPLSEEEWAGPSIIFYKWIPDADTDVIQIISEDVKIRISLDRDCVSKVGEVTAEVINRWVNISVTKLRIEIELSNVDFKLMDFIYDERESFKDIHDGIQPGQDEYDKFGQKYNELGVNVTKKALSAFNRVISYARNIKGQYWLTELNFDINNLHSTNVWFKAQARIDNGPWFKWCPPSNECITIYSEEWSETSIKKEEWENISKHVQSSNKLNFVFELVANAKYLFSNEHMRSAVIEIVIALEVAISKFGKNPNKSILSVPKSYRIDIDNLDTQIKHLGLSGTIRYLIPLLFDRETLPDKTLEMCYEALDVRNNIVHNGQRYVDPTLVRQLLNEVRSCCKILDKYTSE